MKMTLLRLLAILALALTTCEKDGFPERSPNIVFILIDDLRE